MCARANCYTLVNLHDQTESKFAVIFHPKPKIVKAVLFISYTYMIIRLCYIKLIHAMLSLDIVSYDSDQVVSVVQYL